MAKKSYWVVVFTAVALLAITGFCLSRCGGPRVQPLSPDEQRVHDVLSLSWRVVFYAQTRGRLPAFLSDVREDRSEIPTDPVTSSPYFYEVLGHDSFRLCAVFLSEAHQDKDAGVDFLPPSCHVRGAVCYGDPVTHGYGSWEHGAGKQCLDRVAPFMGVLPSLR